METVLKAKYECQKCKSLITVARDTDPSKISCQCGSKRLELLFTDTDPERDKVQLGNTFEMILNTLDYYMDMPLEQRKIIALWIMGTYIHDDFSAYPFLFINAMRGSGKTRLLKLISHLAYGGRGKVQTEPSEPVLFRTPAHYTLVFDEFENVASKDKAIFRQYLNASYKKGGVVQRATKNSLGKFELEEFEPYKPIAMANIWGMEEVLGDRCLTLILQKSSDISKTMLMEEFEDDENLLKIRQNLVTLCRLVTLVTQKKIGREWNNYIKCHYNNITNITNITNNTNSTILENIKMEESFNKIKAMGIDGRNLELIFPLLIIANSLDVFLFEDMIKIFTNLIKEKKEEEVSESKDVCLIEFIAFNYSSNLEWTPIMDLLRHFQAYLGENDNFDDKWLNSKWLGRALKRLDLITDKRKLSNGKQVMLNVVKAKEKLKMFKKEKKE